MTPDTIASILGFAVRAGKVVYGVDAIERGKRVFAVVYCASLSDGSLGKLKKAAAAARTPLVRSERPLEDIVHKTNCKAVGLTDRQMAKAVTAHTNENFILEPAEVQ